VVSRCPLKRCSSSRSCRTATQHQLLTCRWESCIVWTENLGGESLATSFGAMALFLRVLHFHHLYHKLRRSWLQRWEGTPALEGHCWKSTGSWQLPPHAGALATPARPHLERAPQARRSTSLSSSSPPWAASCRRALAAAPRTGCRRAPCWSRAPASACCSRVAVSKAMV